MLIPIDKQAIVEYSLIADTDENKTIFKLGYLTARQKAALAIHTKKTTQGSEENSLWWFTILKFGLKGWTNFKMKSGEEYPFKTDKIVINGFAEFEVLHDDCFEAFTLDQVAELAVKLYEMNYITDVEKKNS